MADSEEKTVTPSVIIKVENLTENPDMPAEKKTDDMKSKNSSSKSSKPSFNIALKPSILKPPQLKLGDGTLNTANSIKTLTLSPPVLNPFTRKEDDCKIENGEKSNGESVKTVSSDQTSSTAPSITSTVTSTTSTVSSTSFIFGQNLKDRVIASELENDESKPSTSLDTNGTTEMLFSDAVKTEVKPNLNTNGKENKSLVETAREYEESRAVKRKYEEVEVKTGEEDETNILCISCKLFSFDGTSGSWQERGRGTLRLNDFEVDDHLQSRLVFRTSGSLRVILNTKVFSSMTAEKASDKSIRLTALDASGEIKIFLVMASVEDSKTLHQHLQQRIQTEIDVCKKRKS